MLNWLARLVTTRRTLVLGVLAVATALLASQIPRIQVDPSVENLISSYEGEDGGLRNAEGFEEDFGDTDRIMVLLVEADDVLRRAPLQYLHDVSGYLQNESWIDNVVSLTRTPLPRRIAADPENLDAGFDLDALEDEEFEDEELDEDAPEGEDLEALPEEEDDGFDPAIVDALIALVEADPDRFPGGFQALGPKLKLELRATPIVEGDEVTDEDVEEIRDTMRQSPLLVGRLVSADGSLAVAALSLADVDSRTMRENVESLRLYLEEHPPPDGVKVHLGGLPYLRSSIVESIRSDQLVLVPLTLVVCMLLLAVSLRWLPGVLLPVAAVGITALMVVGGMGFAGEPFNILNNIIPTLLIIIGISDSIHLIGRYREELDRNKSADKGDPRIEAGVSTIHHMAVACLLTSATTAVGLASLIVSDTVMLRHFGVTAALGVMAAYAVTITFLPAVLTWVRVPSKEARKAGGWLEVAIMKMTAWVLARPWKVLAVSAGILGLCVWGSLRLEVDHALLDQFDEQDPVYLTTRLMEDKLDGVRPLEVSLRSDTEGRFYDPEVLAAVDAAAEWAKQRPEVLGTMSQDDVLRQTLALMSGDESARDAAFVSAGQIRALGSLLGAREEANPLAVWVTPDRRHLRLQIKVKDVGAQATMHLIAALQEQLDESLPDDVTYAFTGEAYSGSTGMDAVVSDLLSSLMLAVVIIFVLLSLLFRSLRLGLLSIPPNVIPLVFTMAYMAMRDIPLNAATVIIFSISLGLAVDGTIHVLARFKEETQERGMQSHPALIRAARGTGRAIVISCVTLMAGFAVLLLSSFVPVRRFGELIAVTVGCTLFATLIVQPALLQVAGVSRHHRANTKIK